MNKTYPFELDTLEHDWIDGVSGRVFLQRVQQCIARIEAASGLGNVRGVLIAEPEPVEFAAAFFASVYIGTPTILANPKWQQSEWEQLGRQLNPALVFGTADISTKETAEPDSPEPGTILIPTGGSSGKLKLAVHDWNTLTSACDGFRSFAGNGPVDSCCVLPLYHVSGLMQLMRSFASGGRIVFTDYRALQGGRMPEIATANLCLSLVPTQLQRLIGQKDVVSWLRSLKAIFLGGAPMSASLQKQARELQLPVVPTYGMTETAAMITALPAQAFLAGSAGVGYALSHAKIQVIREDGSPCLPEETGRIQIQAGSLCRGHYGASFDVSREGYLSTDEGYLDRAGSLHIVGRSDRIIISGGEKIDPLEIEDAFLNTGTVEQALAVGWPDSEWGERLVVFYVSGDKVDDVDALRHQLKASLVNYKIPREIIRVSQLPLTLQGKVDHARIRELLEKSS